MIPYEKGRIAYEDSEIEVRSNPNDPEGYALHIKKSVKCFCIPRDCLEGIASANRDNARILIERLLPSFIRWEDIIGESNLTSDNIVSALTKTHINEEKRMSEL